MNTALMTSATSMSKKLVLSFGFILVSAAYALWSHVGGSASTQTAGALPITPVPAATQPVAPAPMMTGPVPTMMPKPSGRYANGTFTGSPADAYYGTVQVKAIVRNGKLADVQFLQYPNDRQHSLELSTYAMPTLTQEAIRAQSAQVDTVSGATATSDAFTQSLGSALAQATI